MIYRAKHFKRKEFACPCCGIIRISAVLVFWCDILRSALGSALTINSGFRCETRNDLVGGTIMSRHMIGCAADLRLPSGMKFEIFSNILMRVVDANEVEIKLYPQKAFIHFGVPRNESSKLWLTEGSITV